jgi:hypothetical protein
MFGQVTPQPSFPIAFPPLLDLWHSLYLFIFHSSLPVEPVFGYRPRHAACDFGCSHLHKVPLGIPVLHFQATLTSSGLTRSQ